MICICGFQMHQLVRDGSPVGWGEGTDTIYTTTEVKECPACKRKVLETYEAKQLTHDETLDILLKHKKGVEK